MEHIIVNLGLLLALAAGLSLLAFRLKQPMIFAFLLTGVIAGLFDHHHFPEELMDAFTEVGIIMLLFLAGLEVDIKKFRQHLKSVLINGIGQILLNAAVGFLLAWFFLGLENVSSALFFGLCLTFSSTIIVIGTLKKRREMKSLHGQIILGLMVLQDIVAVLSLSVIKGMQSGGPLGPELASLFIKLIAVTTVLLLSSQYLLPWLFNYAARSSELLLLTTLGYILGVSAFCEMIHFSPEIGAFLAGVSLAVMPVSSRFQRKNKQVLSGSNPFKLEIEDSIEALKTFGVILFFISLGFKLDFSGIGVCLFPIIVCSLIVLLGTPVLMLLLGNVAGLKSRPAFYSGFIINQISEFSLILATLCLGAGIFDRTIFTVITLSCIATIFISSYGHRYIDLLYSRAGGLARFMDRNKTICSGEYDEVELTNHILLLGYSEIAESVADYYSKRGREVYALVLDPQVFKILQSQNNNVIPVYADVADSDVWAEMKFDQASLIVSCEAGVQMAELGIAGWLTMQKAEVPFLAVTDSRQEARELYEAGARYVIQTDDLAAERLVELFDTELQGEEPAFLESGKKHYQGLKDANNLWIFG
ncbi:cation:proton antiporter [Pontiellaceae bacterium B12227]|nr:cation:proton antiporter [Pontiellaceae bacterium B12227]